MAIEVFAPAKINLALHVTGRRHDGYHLLDSIVTFADIGDRVMVEHSDRLTLAIAGPEAGVLAPGDDSNLVLRAARFFDPGCTARMTLTKYLPVASGIGGGSADAAATLRALSLLYGRDLPPVSVTAALGADVPACLAGRSLRIRGVGEIMSDIPALPAFGVLLVNPRVALPTPDVFAALSSRHNPPLPDTLPGWRDQHDFCAWLGHSRNDLLQPAQSIVPEISNVLSAIRQTGCLFAGMSGSGATCFGLYMPGGRAADASAGIGRDCPGWWCRAGALI